MRRLSAAERALQYAALGKRRNSQGPQERLLSPQEFPMWREVWLYTAHGMATTERVKDAVVVLSGYINSKSLDAWVSQKTLREVGNDIPPRTLGRAMANLRNGGYGLIERTAKGTNRFTPCLPKQAEAFARTVVARLPYNEEMRAIANEMVDLHLLTRTGPSAKAVATRGAEPSATAMATISATAMAAPIGQCVAEQIPLNTYELPLKKDSQFDSGSKEASKEEKKESGEKEGSHAATSKPPLKAEKNDQSYYWKHIEERERQIAVRRR
jgi:hypothetical protein